MIAWGILTGVRVLTGTPPSASTSLQRLPESMELGWALLMMTASMVTLTGLFIRLAATIAAGMQAFGAILGAYGAAIVAASGWQRGGTIAAFLVIIGIVCLLRGWWLKEEEAARIKESQRTEGT